MNVVTLVGRLTTEPDTRTVTVAGAERAVTTLALAVPSDTNRTAQRLYVDVVVWDAAARACATYLHQGRRVAVSGRLELNRWTADDGASRRAHRVVAHQVEFLDGSRPGERNDEQDASAEPDLEPIAEAVQ